MNYCCVCGVPVTRQDPGYISDGSAVATKESSEWIPKREVWHEKCEAEYMEIKFKQRIEGLKL